MSNPDPGVAVITGASSGISKVQQKYGGKVEVLTADLANYEEVSIGIHNLDPETVMSADEAVDAADQVVPGKADEESGLPLWIRQTTKGKTMTDDKLYLLAEFSVKPQLVNEVKEIFSRLLPTVLKEQGCEAMYTTSINGDPNKLVFFEVFSSQAAHDFHMAQDYTRKLAVDLEGKLEKLPVMTKLNAF